MLMAIMVQQILNILPVFLFLFFFFLEGGWGGGGWGGGEWGKLVHTVKKIDVNS